MVIREYGTQNQRILVFFQGSCEPYRMFVDAAKGLSQQFHVLLVTPDGHDPTEQTDFISVEKTVKDTADWLKKRGITKVDAMYGLSFGGGMVIRFLVSEDIPVSKAIIDAGTAPYQYPKWICRLIAARDYMMLKLARTSVRLMEAASPIERYAKDPQNAKQEYEAIRRYLKTYSDRTLWNIFWSANNYAVPKTPPAIDTRIQFWVGTDEWKSRLRDLKWTKNYLPMTEIVKIPNRMHGEYVMMHPQEFTAQALAFLNEEEV